MILPINHFNGNSVAENIIWKKFRDFIPEDFVSFHNYYIGIRQPDIILLVPNKGILIIEIKGYYAKNILDVPDNSIIRFKNKPNEPSPFSQAITYRNILINDFLKPNSLESIFVTCAVCYPYITKEEYVSKGLNKISHERLTITADDLESQCTLLNKIEDVFNLLYEHVHHIDLDRYGFNRDLVEKTGNIISPNFRIDICEDAENKDEIEEYEQLVKSEEIEDMIEDVSERKFYSRLLYVKDSSRFQEDEINGLMHQWKLGTNIYFYTSDSSLLGSVLERVQNLLRELALEDKEYFEFKGNKTFLFNSGLISELDVELDILNGENYGKYSHQFSVLHKESGFNKEQYEIEHAPLENIIVKAGAGTGKTYSIMSRINYLVWKMRYTAEDMKNHIAMITFTNDSVDDMKRKLTENFENYYLLTRNTNYLDYIEGVENMNISTIHSMAKKVLQKYSSRLGYGKDFKIVTGNFIRSQILHRNLNKLIEDQKIEKDINMKVYFLEKRLLNFIDKLDNKNIDIVSDFDELDFGVSNPKVFEKLIDVIRETQKEMSFYCQDQNVISLGDLIRKLRELYESMKSSNITETEKIDFLFVDEFQDTDDVQINVIKSFKNIFGYKLFVVGDIKQCIYRFRGAEVKAFDTLTNGSIEKFINISLNKNYRTDELLLDKLNDIFTKWNNNGDLEYSGNDVLIATKNYNEITELHKVEYIADEFDKQLVKNISESILKVSAKKDNKKSKIAILTRYNWQIAEIKEICERNGINVDTDIGGELFKIDPTVDLYKLILALKYNRSAKYLYNLYTTSYICEDIPKAVLLRKSESDIVDYFYDNIPSSLRNWNSYISRLREEPVLKVIRDIVDDSKPWSTFAKKVKAKGDEIEKKESYYIRNLDQLFENLVEASNTDFLTINKISEYLDIMIVTHQDEEARASYDLEKSSFDVICTTVHKSKGLEFDTVILPYCDFDVSCSKAKGEVDLVYSENKIGYLIKSPDNEEAFKNDIYNDFQKGEIKDRTHEETRILYVALTRAIKKIVIFSKSYGKKPYKYWADMIGEV